MTKGHQAAQVTEAAQDMTDTDLNLLLRASLALCKGGKVEMQVPAEYHLERGAIRWVGECFGIVQMCPATRYRVVERTSESTYRILGDWHTDSVWLAIYRADEMERQRREKFRHAVGDLANA